jgi:quinol monooxygenase YgiN
MNPKVLTVVAHVKSKDGMEEAMRKELLPLVGLSRKHAGCLNYDLHQSVEVPGQFYFHENWASRGDWDAHMQNAELKEVLGRVGQMVAEPPQITLWERIG